MIPVAFSPGPYPSPGLNAAPVDTTEMEFRVFNLRPDPHNEVTYENRDRIVIQELDGLCAPGLTHA